MALQAVTNINIDFYEKKYVLVNAKQYDKNSRVIVVTCYNHGNVFHVNPNEHDAYVKYKKADSYGVFNFCEIDSKGKVLVKLTEQMLAVSGLCPVDLVIVNKGSATIDVNTGEIIAIDEAEVLSTMTFYVDVSESSIENYDIESSYEFNALNKALEEVKADYRDVIRLAKSYAIGDADGARENEDIDNSKYYSEQANKYNNLAHNSEINAAASASEASTHASNALSYSSDAEASKLDAMDSAADSMAYAGRAESALKTVEGHVSNAKEYADSSLDNMNMAKSSATSAATSALNAKNYFEKFAEVMASYNGTFLPMGTVSFSDLAELVSNGQAGIGFLYNISDEFVTDETFKEGAGIEYPAGVNVYYTADGYWDCFVGSSVVGIKGEKETDYRRGTVNISAENVGAVSIDAIATVEDVTSYIFGV